MNRIFCVGLPTVEKEGFVDAVIAASDEIGEVYFSLPEFANGRGRGADEEYLARSLSRIRNAGIGFNLLFNASCYGDESLSRVFFDRVGRALEDTSSRYGLSSVTTTSPVIARFVKEYFPSLTVKASVNMQISSVESASYVLPYFDGFYLSGEGNRSLRTIKEMRRFCDENGKKLYLLANSGCLVNCSAHQFHNNLVSHEEELSRRDNFYTYRGICQEFWQRSPVTDYLMHTSFIRPEDIDGILPYFDGIKLATRISPSPVRILDAYIHRRYSGAVTALLEPDHTALFYPNIIANERISSEWLPKRLGCDRRCDACDLCRTTVEKALFKPEDYLC